MVARTLRAELPPETIEILSSGYVVALNKDNAPGDVRPIVLMDTLLKFAERYALGQEIERMATLFEKERQYGGAGVKGGQEAAVHATRLQLSLAAMRAHYDDQEEEWGALQLDVVNAFGTLSRTAIARATRDHLPSWVPATAFAARPAAAVSAAFTSASAAGADACCHRCCYRCCRHILPLGHPRRPVVDLSAAFCALRRLSWCRSPLVASAAAPVSAAPAVTTGVLALVFVSSARSPC